VSLCPILCSTVCSLSIPHTVPPLGSVSLCPLLCFTVRQYLTMYRLLILYRHVHCCLLLSVSISPCSALGSVSLCTLMCSTFCPLSDSTTHCTVPWFCATVSTAVFHSHFTVCRDLTMYRALILCHYVHCCLLHSVH
jgi:hypothetical protein